ncbi:hypothetical protein QTP88_009270 [Uroleucon formosanum]
MVIAYYHDHKQYEPDDTTYFVWVRSRLKDSAWIDSLFHYFIELTEVRNKKMPNHHFRVVSWALCDFPKNQLMRVQRLVS